MSDYYVYQWVDMDTGLPFYVGKGHGDRMNSMKNRSARFIDYLTNHTNCRPEIIKDNLTEDDAFDIERKTISEYKENGTKRVNIAYGGRGGIHLFGNDNPMKGRPWYTDVTPEEKIAAWRKKIGRSGEANPMWGVSPSDRMDEETYKRWREAHKQITGEKNPNYGNHVLAQYYSDHPDIAKAKQGRPGIANGRCRPIRVTKPDGTSAEFSYMTECAKAISNEINTPNIQYLAVKISECAKAHKAYKGYTFEFI